MLSNCRVGAIVFFVSVLERSLAFYRDTLGLPVVALHASVAFAAETGDMGGRVVDDAGNPVAGATVTVSGAEIAGVRTATADDNGNFSILGLPVGSHEVLVEADEYAPVRLLDAVQARFLLVSFPAQSLGGRRKGMAAHYENRFQRLLEDRNWPVQRFEFTTELAFLVRKDVPPESPEAAGET